jgi:hypothetical protein
MERMGWKTGGNTDWDPTVERGDPGVNCGDA